MELERFLAAHQLPDTYADTAQKWFTPLAQEIALHAKGAADPFFVGVNGCQGSGKSTLCDFLKFYLEQQNCRVVVLSLDDFYLSKSDRASLAVKVHPLLATRGVPGTHDTLLAEHTLSQLKQHKPAALPRFNKATDNPHPKDQWPTVDSAVDIVLVEGWCWGVPAQSTQELTHPVNTLEREEDALGIWRRFVNKQLAGPYQALFNTMQYWVMLKGPSFDHVYQWRCEQEHKLAAKQEPADNTHIMTDEQISRFIQHYQRLTEQCFDVLPARCNTVFELDGDRKITRAYKGTQ